MMEVQQNEVALPLRSHNILGVCEGIGEHFRFNPVLLRIPFAVGVLWTPLLTFAAYLGLGAVVLASRLLFPRPTPAGAQAAAASRTAANEETELASAA